MKRVAVIGAGAAGSMAAIWASASGAETLLLERKADGGRKILISGGGRCNILPAREDTRRFVTDSSPNTLRKLLRSWPLAEQVSFFEEVVGIPLVEEEESAKLFPASNRARDVWDGLLDHAVRRGARYLPGTLVTNLAQVDGRWRVDRAGASPLDVDAVIVATGGLSVPATGSDGLGLRILEGLGLAIHPTYAALTPLIAQPAPFADLAGVSLEVTITARSVERSATATGGFLFTHRGYSGPAVLDVSHVLVRSCAPGVPTARIVVKWSRLDDQGWEAALRPSGSRTVSSALRAELPERLAVALAAGASVDPGRRLAELRREERLRLVETLVRGDLPWTGHEGFKKGEVTGGGVSLAEIDPGTMECRRLPGLFLCGELLDAFGPIGGYNFQWAWATGRAAALGACGDRASDGGKSAARGDSR